MINSISFRIDLALFILQIVITTCCLYSAWTNLVQKQISKVGFDAFILLFYNKERSAAIRRNPQLIKRMGIITLLVAVGGINEVTSIFVERIWPFIH